MPSKKATKPRDRKAENTSAFNAQIDKVADMRLARANGSLGDEVIKMAQSMIMCTLPYSKTDEKEIIRKARLGDGSTLTVIFQATEANRGVPMPYGADRHLLAWIFDRAIRSDSPYIAWESASEYRREMGLSIGGSGLRQLTQRFERLSSLLVQIRRDSDSDPGIGKASYMIVEKSYLPKSITGRELDPSGQAVLPGLSGRYGFQLSQGLWQDIKRYHRVLPRQIWRELEGSSQLQDLVYWLIIRCYEAKSQTVIPWEALELQFPQDKNPRRLRATAKQAVKYIRTIWPEVRLWDSPAGLKVDYCPEPLMPDDPSKGRVRRLRAGD